MLATFLVCVTILMLVNGFSDAPNVITTVITTGAWSSRRAAFVAALANLLGTAFVGLYFPAVSETLRSLGFSETLLYSYSAHTLLAALSAGILASGLYAIVMSVFGLPTSESHGLMAGMAGSVLALSDSFSSGNLAAIRKILVGLIVSTLPAFLIAVCLTGFLKKGREKGYLASEKIFCVVGAFLHGAQDGGKLAGVMLAGLSLCAGYMGTPPLLPIVLYAGAMISLGTLLGGERIVKRMGETMVALDPRGGTAADISSALLLMLCTVMGLPVSTTHAKMCAMLGAGVGEGKRVDSGTVRDLFLAWVLTFPVCFFLSYLSVRFLFVQ